MKIYLSGIGGIGMSAYAGHALARGDTIIGSDRQPSPITDAFEKKGVKIVTDQDGSAIPEDSDLFVYSEAIAPDASERRRADELGIRSLSYFEALGELTKDTQLIAVCGSHGKSSTTAMAAKMLLDAKRDPSVVVGTKMKELGGQNWRAGSNLWIVEACEYRGSFLALLPKIIMVTNIERDHVDAFPTEESYDEVFQSFFSRLPDDGVILYHGNDERSARLVKESGKRAIDVDAYSLPEVGTPGEHMRRNAQLALGLAVHLGIDDRTARESLAGYAGSWRRMERVGTTKGGADVINDYAHHPTEIRETLRALHDAFPSKNLIVAFQPHTHDRTLALWDDFASAFSDAARVVLLDVYDARPHIEEEHVKLDAFAKAIRTKSACSVDTAEDLTEAAEKLDEILTPDDLCVTMGAGSVGTLPERIVVQR